MVFASLIDRSISWQSLDVTLDSSLNTLIVRDLTHETIEELDFRDRVIDFTVAYDQLVAVTNYQVFFYALVASSSMFMLYYYFFKSESGASFFWSTLKA